MDKFNVLHVITDLGLGGAQKVVLDLCTQRDKSQTNVIVVSLRALEDTIMFSEFEKNKIKVIVLDLKKSLVSFFSTARQLMQIVKENKIQILHAHMIHSCFISTVVKLVLPQVKVVFTSHSFNLESRFRSLFVFLTKGLRSADIIFSKKMHSSFYKNEVAIIPNGISMNSYQIKTPKFDCFTFLCIGRLITVKNQLALISPVKNLIGKGFSFKVLLVGDGKDGPIIKAAIKNNNLEDVIILLGRRTDVPLLCNKAHCLVLPSLWEGFPIALLEAGASGLPVITTNVGSIDTLVDEKTGYLLSDISQLQQTMKDVIVNYELAKRKGKAFQQVVKTNFSISTVVKQHENLYNKLLVQPNFTFTDEFISN